MTVRLGTTLQLLTCTLLYWNGHSMVDPIHPLDRVSLATIVLCKYGAKVEHRSARLQQTADHLWHLTPHYAICQDQ